jgi:hypothetical protein
VCLFLARLIKADFESVSFVAIDVLLILALFANIIFLLWMWLLWRCAVKTREFHKRESEIMLLPSFSNLSGSLQQRRTEDEEEAGGKIR